MQLTLLGQHKFILTENTRSNTKITKHLIKINYTKLIFRIHVEFTK